MITSGIQAGPRYVPTLMELIAALGLPAPVVCLDAGDINSWPGSGQRWLDASGNGNNFFLGTSASVEAASIEPVFNGTPGNRSENEYFGVSPTGDNTTLFTAEVPALFTPFHKDNNLFSIATIWKNPSGAVFPFLWGNMNGTPQDGIGLRTDNPTRNAQFYSDPTVGAGGVVIKTSTFPLPVDTICIHTVASDEAGGAGRQQVNQNAADAFVPAVSTNTNAPANTFTLGRFTGTGGLLTGMRYYGFVVWASALSATNVALFNKYAKELRFPSSP